MPDRIFHVLQHINAFIGDTQMVEYGDRFAGENRIAGKSGVPFMKSTTSLVLTIPSIRSFHAHIICSRF
jgi:hypothetical protein